MILVDAESLSVEPAQIELGDRVALLGRLAIPDRGLRMVLREAEPVLIIPQSQATARSAMKASSVSPERWLMMLR